MIGESTGTLFIQWKDDPNHWDDEKDGTRTEETESGYEK